MAGDELTGWALAAAAGDEEAAAAFVRGSQAEVWRLVAHLVSREVADDLTQETYLRAFRGLGRFRAHASARTWLLSIARRVAADHLRSRGRRLPETTDADADMQVGAAGSDPASHVPLLLLDRVELDQREAFVLTQLLGLSYAAAAEVCACPVGTVRSRVARARATLAACLDAGGYGTHTGTDREP